FWKASTKNKATLVLAKLGHVKMVMHRPLKGTPKQAIVKRTPTGKWFVAISVEQASEDIQVHRLTVSCEEVGIEVGLSTGEEIARLSRTAKGSKQREKQRKVVVTISLKFGTEGILQWLII